AFDPGSIVNPAIVKAQVESAAALGLSSVLFEQIRRGGVRGGRRGPRAQSLDRVRSGQHRQPGDRQGAGRVGGRSRPVLGPVRAD
ncbi:hypothetical protein CTI14_66845, partial [Methylobacterium radiotolerans]